MRKLLLAVVTAASLALATPASAEPCDLGDLGRDCNADELIANLVANPGCTGLVNVCDTYEDCEGAVNYCWNAETCTGIGVSVCESAYSCTSDLFNWC